MASKRVAPGACSAVSLRLRPSREVALGAHGVCQLAATRCVEACDDAFHVRI